MFISGFLCQKLDYSRKFGTLRVMANIERQDGEKEHRVDPVEILARYEAGIIRELELSDEESFNLHLAKGIMLDDPAFEAKVRQRQAELEDESKARQADPKIIERDNTIEIVIQVGLGRIKTQDLSEENKSRVESLRKEAEENPELAKQISDRQNEIILKPVKVSKEKRHFTKKINDPYIQPGLWQSEPQPAEPTESLNQPDPEREIMKVGKKLNGRLGGYNDKALRKEIRIMKTKLRNEIGLPVVRKGGEHEHFDDHFYKFLVRRVVSWDVLHIFGEYVGVVGEPSEELKSRIAEVKNLVNKLLNGDLKIHEKYSAFYDFIDEHGYDRFKI